MAGRMENAPGVEPKDSAVVRVGVAMAATEKLAEAIITCASRKEDCGYYRLINNV